MSQILFGIVSFFVAFQLVYSILMFLGVRKLRSNTRNYLLNREELPPISIIVTARNEAENLLANVPTILNQDYPSFELVLVNDRSIDNSIEVMKAFESSDKRVKLVSLDSINEFNQGLTGKKLALTLGIKAASFEHLAFTDADCSIEDSDWLFKLGSEFHAGSDFIIGSGFYKARSSIEKLYQNVHFFSALQYLVASSFGINFMCVGRSMAYTKALFFSVDGFKKHMHIESGSDDLFLQTVSSRSKVSALPSASTYSNPPSSIRSWLDQRKRHLGAGMYYPKGILMALFCVEISRLITPIGLVIGFFLPIPFQWILILWALYLLRYFVMGLAMNDLKNLAEFKSNLFGLILLEFPSALLNALFSGSSLIRKPTVWMREK